VLDPNHPAYAHYYARAISALAQRYDMDPRLDSVDIGVVGPWGEDEGIQFLDLEKRNHIIDAYLNGFNNTPLMGQIGNAEALHYIVRKKPNVGIRGDCLGDMSFFGDTMGWAWAHMRMVYPFVLGQEGIRDMWKTGPISFESCGVMYSWMDNYAEHIDTIIDQSLAWHISTFNAKSSPVPPEWMPHAERWLKRMGYRFALRTAHLPAQAAPGDCVAGKLWLQNLGVAPSYRAYPFYLRLTNGTTCVDVKTAEDIRKWMPGDSMVDLSIELPPDLAPDTYAVQVAILNPRTGKPNIRFACDAPCQDGYYTIGSVKVEKAD